MGPAEALTACVRRRRLLRPGHEELTMKKRVFVSAVCATIVAAGAIVTTQVQDGANAQAIAALPFHLVENFFHYPAYSVIGRLSGVAVSPNGNIVALNRGYHP